MGGAGLLGNALSTGAFRVSPSNKAGPGKSPRGLRRSTSDKDVPTWGGTQVTQPIIEPHVREEDMPLETQRLRQAIREYFPALQRMFQFYVQDDTFKDEDVGKMDFDQYWLFVCDCKLMDPPPVSRAEMGRSFAASTKVTAQALAATFKKVGAPPVKLVRGAKRKGGKEGAECKLEDLFIDEARFVEALIRISHFRYPFIKTASQRLIQLLERDLLKRAKQLNPSAFLTQAHSSQMYALYKKRKQQLKKVYVFYATRMSSVNPAEEDFLEVRARARARTRSYVFNCRAQSQIISHSSHASKRLLVGQ